MTSSSSSSGRGGANSSSRGAFIPQTKAHIRLAQLNMSTGSPQGAGNHNMQNSQGQNIGGNNNDSNGSSGPIYIKLYHFCRTTSGSARFIQCDVSGILRIVSSKGGEWGNSTRIQVGTTSTGRGSTPVYTYTPPYDVQCDPTLRPIQPLTGMITLPINLIQGKTLGAQSNSSTAVKRSPLVRLAANTTKYTYVSSVTPVGQTLATTPPAYPTTKTGIKLIAGTAYEGNNGGLVCVVESSAGTFCDGHGTSTLQGQLGNNSFAQQSGPKLVYDATQSQSVTKLSTAGGYTCAVTGGYLECWGVNSSGQLGIGNTSNQSKPMRVTSWP